jgi:hypothetical protein
MMDVLLPGKKCLVQDSRNLVKHHGRPIPITRECHLGCSGVVLAKWHVPHDLQKLFDDNEAKYV